MLQELILAAGHTEQHDWRRRWRERNLFDCLAWRDILGRDQQTVIGISWAVIGPFLTMLVFTVVFHRIANLQAPGGLPYALFVFAAMLPWQFFATVLSESSASLLGNANLLSKVYFPRLIIPAGAVVTALVDFLITLGLMGLMMLWYGFLPDWRLLTLPLFLGLACGAALGAGLWLCALNVKYRDFRYIVPFVVQFGLYISPVGFSSHVVPEHWQWLYALNPMVGIIDGFRWALLRGEVVLWWPSLLTSVLLTAALCVSGIRYFRRMERTFADVI